ncbi:hypothetical protein ACROYT_G037169 [Oculina patagonica]
MSTFLYFTNLGYESIDAEIGALEDELAQLDLEEQKQAKLRKVASLQKQVSEKRAKIQAAAMQADDVDCEIPQVPRQPPGPSTISALKRAVPGTPLDGLLQPLLDPLHNAAITTADHLPSWNGQVPTAPAGRNNSWLEAKTSEMFLKPAHLPKGEKALRIIDFVDNIVPRDDERTLSDSGNTKLIVSYGPKKPRLEQVSLNQWVLADIGATFTAVDMQNYKSATNANARDKVEQTIRDELRQGNYVITTVKPTVVSALGAIPKPNSTEVRIIHDCSRPHGRAVNDYITTRSFKFQSLDDAIKLLQPNYYMAKIDLKHAYRSVPIHPANYQATGCKWRFTGDNFDTFFYDTRLPFGAKSSPEIFHRITQAVRRMMAKRGYHNIIVYLDDFLVIGATRAECEQAYNTLLALLQDLGFTISQHKLVPPTQRLTFLGVQLDTGLCTMTLPAEKLMELQTIVCTFLNKRRATKNQLQRLAGKLNWACRVVYGGRTFLRRVLDTMNSMSASAKHKLSDSFYRDISWWVNFLKVFNGTRLFLNQQPTVDVMTDACSLAAGGYFRGDWFYFNFALDNPAWAHLHINHKETLAIILAAKRWAPLWAHHRVIIHSDNQAAVQIINKGTTGSSVITDELRALFWLSAIYNFHISGVYIEGSRNSIADAISRLHERQSLLWFYSILRDRFQQQAVDDLALDAHMSVYSSFFISSRCTRSSTGLATTTGSV